MFVQKPVHFSQSQQKTACLGPLSAHAPRSKVVQVGFMSGKMRDFLKGKVRKFVRIAVRSGTAGNQMPVDSDFCFFHPNSHYRPEHLLHERLNRRHPKPV